MKFKILLSVAALILLVSFTACSGGDSPSVPSDGTQEIAGLVPDFTPPAPPRDSNAPPLIPPSPEFAIELHPEGDAVEGNFKFGDIAVEGIEVRINDELAGFTDEFGDFEIPAILDGDHTISFGIMGEIIHSQPYSPVSRFAQDASNPGPGVMTGIVYDAAGPVPGALVLVIKGDSYSYGFSGQYGAYGVAGAPCGNALAVCMADFHDPVFVAVNLPEDGTPLEQDFYLPQNNTYGTIYGRVMAPDFGPVPHALVTFEAPGVFRADLSNIFGIFELEMIPVGFGHIKCEREYFYTVEGDIPVHAGLNPIGIFTRLIEQSTVHGHVMNQEGQPMDGVLVRLAVWGAPDTAPKVYGRISGPGGYFSFQDLLPGSFLLEGFQPGYIPGSAYGFMLPGSLHEENIIMQPGSGGYTGGFVKDVFEAPIPGAVVVLDYIASDLAIAAITDDNGNYAFPGVPFGACTLTAYATENLPKTVHFDVMPGETEGYGIFLFPVPDQWPTGTVTGYSLNIADQPVPYNIVWLYNMNNPGVSFMTVADDTGAFTFPKALEGTNGGWSIASGYIPDDGYVNVVAGEVAELDFSLTPE